jgi:hypothetical protein
VAARTDNAPDQARDTRARALAFVFKCWQEKRMGCPTTSGPDEAKEITSVRATKKYTGPS